jgi:Ala-tRNA(Pro) deacylase
MSISTRLTSFLDENKIPYSVMTHTRAYTAQGAAATMQVSGKELAKAVVLWTGEEMILAVLPAPHHVRLDQLAAEVGKSVRLATEAEFSSLFPDCELGAMPPFGSLYNLPVYVTGLQAAICVVELQNLRDPLHFAAENRSSKQDSSGRPK